jgi:hypothetical protein
MDFNKIKKGLEVEITKEEDEYLNILAVLLVDMAVDDLIKKNQRANGISNFSKMEKTLKK